MSKIRVVEKPDGTISVHHPSPKSKHGIDGALDKIIKGRNQQGLPAYDIDTSDLPQTREDRDCWEFDESSKKVKVNAAKKQAKDQAKAEKDAKKASIKQKLKDNAGMTDDEVAMIKFKDE